MKIGLLLPTNLSYCPYAKIYTQLLDYYHVSYDLIVWNKDNIAEFNVISFVKASKTSSNQLIKLLCYLQYSFFIRNLINRNKYDKLIVFGPQIGIFLYPFLRNKYKGNFVFDYRDHSIDQMFIFKKIFSKLLSISFLNVISSPGYLKCLPKEFKYVISHNFDIELVRKNLLNKKKGINLSAITHVLTIGGIRNYEANLAVIQSLGNNEKYILKFAGKGEAVKLLKKYVIKNKINNVFFHGFYQKEEESKFVIKSTLLNIYFPNIISHSTIMSNRFYLALIYKIPMLVTSNSTQGDYVEKFNLGLCINNTENLDMKIQDYLKRFDANSFSKNCNRLLESFVKDYLHFEKLIVSFINS